jgi:Tol biopolymer transport system component
MKRVWWTVIIIAAGAAGAGAWMTPGNLGTGVNSNAIEIDPQPTQAGTRLYFSSDRSGGYGGYDIWYSNYSGGWQPATNFGSVVNTAANERAPMYFEAGNMELYYASNRSGGAGGFDIYRTIYTGGTWQPPVRQTPLCSAGDDTQPYLLNSPRRCFFSSNRSGGSGGYDIYLSTYSGGNWSTPVNLGAAVNTSADEISPTFNGAFTTLFFSSNRAGGLGDYDIYTAHPVGNSWGNVANIGSPINTTGFEGTPGINDAGTQLYFASNRSAGYGGYDIWGTNSTTALAPASLGRVKAAFE